ncbi:MAG TPA: gluconate 2-dehydrogenase subunit 3 family protein [Gemmatimonas sp.]|uniref:gluconate 2-dehydrogenase subunit 3 family protein n=1 Tax=Gemmatimonas sp. TaxID=1962908 RepID=UPI002EDAC9F7
MTNEPEVIITPLGMHRREAIRRVSLLLGGVAFVGGTSLLEACAGDAPAGGRSTGGGKAIGTFSVQDQAFLDEIADTILPTTDKSPGAKAAATGAFMALMVTDTYTPEDQAIFRSGMSSVDHACRTAHRTSFMDATSEQRTAVLAQLDQEQHGYMRDRKSGEPTHYFRMMKELSLLGFFTSEIGYNQAMRYKETPGAFEPCTPYTPGETIWASHA